MDKLAEELLDENEILDSIDIIDDKTKMLEDIDALTNEVKSVQQSANDIKIIGNPALDDTLFSEISDLNDRASSILDVCRDAIESTSIIDAELVSAYSQLIKSASDVINYYLSIYRDRTNFLNKVELEKIKQEHRLELLNAKNNNNDDLNNYEKKKIFVQEAVIDYLEHRAKDL
jgi:hypothetical protein